MIKVLIVDDSMFFRFTLRSIFDADPEVTVVGEAVNGEEAVAMAGELLPDVITMDVEMPVLDGIAAVERIMEASPKPIIMVSNHTQSGSDATIAALSIGAVDFIAKKSSLARMDINRVSDELLEKVHYWGANTMPFFRHRVNLDPNQSGSFSRLVVGEGERRDVARTEKTPVVPQKKVDLAVVGVSTGGPAALTRFLSDSKPLPCPLLVAQHMPSRFTQSLANHLAAKTGKEVLEGQDGMSVSSGKVYIAPGAHNLTIEKNESGTFFLKVRQGPDTPYKPSVDLLFESAARVARSPVAIIMTGMGDDGSAGARFFCDNGFPVLAQTVDSCVVDGMPGAAGRAGVVDEFLPLADLYSRVAHWAKKE